MKFGCDKKDKSKQFSKKNKGRGIIPSGFKIYYYMIVPKTAQYKIKRHIEQWDRIENPEIHPYYYSFSKQQNSTL